MMLSLMALAVAPAPPPAPDPVIAGWHLERRRQSCFIEAVSDKETYLKIEHDPLRGITYMSISANTWSGLTDGQTYRVGLRRLNDNQPRVEMRATAATDEDSRRSIVVFALPRQGRYSTGRPMIDQLRHTRMLEVDLDGALALRIGVGGLNAAIPALNRCAVTVRDAQPRPVIL